jgi:hypothetical protein
MYYLLIFLVILLIVALKGPVCEECGLCGERDASANHDGLCDRCWFLFGGNEFNKKEK